MCIRDSTEVVHYLDLATRTWVTPTPVGEEVLPLLGHTAAAIGAELWVFGGRDARRSYNHVWKLDTTTHEWASFRGAHAPTGMVPPPSSKHVMSVQGTKLLVVLDEIGAMQLLSPLVQSLLSNALGEEYSLGNPCLGTLPSPGLHDLPFVEAIRCRKDVLVFTVTSEEEYQNAMNN